MGGAFYLVLLMLVSVSGTVDATAPDLAHVRAHHAIGRKIRISGISDAGEVSPFLYRGTQPSAEGVVALRKLGVDTIVDLRGERRGLMHKEREHAEKLGMRLVSLPGNGWSPPRDEQLAQFFALLRERPRRRIFVHCWLGGDRAGVFVAAYRITFEHWTPEEALAEMRAFHFHGFWHPALKAYIRQFPERLARSRELRVFRSEESAESR